jgi:caspase domain-containing protein
MWIAAVVLAACAVQSQAVGRHALLIGINDYSGSHLQASSRQASRDVPNLDGTINDVHLIKDLLGALYGFQPAEIVTLTDQQATRAAIFDAMEKHLVEPVHKGDIVFFFFSGHGSQVKNSRSREADGLDESILPADSRQGAPDIRDKELLGVFNRIIDRGARLTIVFDACHSGSGARGLFGGLRYRGVRPDLRDVADPAYGPSPESRGALVLAAAQDFDFAFETMDEGRNIRGAFTWALARAMRDARPGEPASETFLRAQALLHAERPAQEPVIAGTTEARNAPFLGWGTRRRGDEAFIAVQRMTGANQYLLQGGWASGVTVGSELRLHRDCSVRLEVTALAGIVHSVARVTGHPARLQPGDLLEIVTWAAPPSAPLRIWIPRADFDVRQAAAKLRAKAARQSIRWIDDPTETTPTHLLRWRGRWELATNGSPFAAAESPLTNVPAGALLFVQLPAPQEIFDALSAIHGVELGQTPDGADYIVSGRLDGDRLQYACIRPFADARDAARSILPLRTAWIELSKSFLLRDRVVRLRVVQGWQNLRAPATAASPYRLAVRRAADDAPITDGRLVGGTRYELVLRAREPASSAPVFARYMYAFVIDSDGDGVLLFPPPDEGNVENLLPVTTTPAQALREPPTEIALSATRPFIVGEPYGLDTYFLLSTEEPLPDFDALEWKGVRAAGARAGRNALQELLAETISGTRVVPLGTPPTWSIDKVTFESVPPRRTVR